MRMTTGKSRQNTSGLTFYLQALPEMLSLRIRTAAEPADMFADVKRRTHVKMSPRHVFETSIVAFKYEATATGPPTAARAAERSNSGGRLVAYPKK
jgi:hypothetical protein